MAPGKRFWQEVTVSLCTQDAYNTPQQDPACAFAQTAHVEIYYCASPAKKLAIARLK